MPEANNASRARSACARFTASCTDEIDDDADGLRDCRDAELGCAEDCGNGLDDDGDGVSDCVNIVCGGHPACADTCPDATLSSAPSRWSGSTLGAVNLRATSCGGGLAGDRTVAFVAPAAGTWVVSATGAQPGVVALLDGDCTAPSSPAPPSSPARSRRRSPSIWPPARRWWSWWMAS